ncbi:MAG: helix-turn-helix domain-containing protein [Desulfobulbaceae bacterium]|nr:helix-turn-helix domain-containing protein [Desulfobulbaceae bacterium]
MTICPICEGKKKGLAFLNRGEDYRTHTQQEIVCLTCNGQGTITTEMMNRINKGKELRKRRIAKRLTLRQAASKLGILPSQLSAIEHGRVVN